jgi:peptidoglycan/xylan/chitin deacetylase (PgdA/CDA1 family)
MRLLATAVTCMTAAALAAAGPAAADDHPWKRAPKPGAYTKWPLPAAGQSQSGAPEIIWTFDDGPHIKYTPKILDLLKEHHIKAIFFWVGWRMLKESPRRAARRALVDRAIREGHIVANHSFTHKHLCRLGRDQMVAEIDRTTEVFEQLSGMPIVFYRTPYGDHCRRLLEVLDQRPFDHLHWDIDPQEWKDHDGIRVAGTLRRKISKVGRHNRRAVIIMHDTHKASVVGLPIALDWLDRENRRRVARGEPPIRSLSGSDLAQELMDRELAAWVGSQAGRAGGRLADALSSLVP